MIGRISSSSILLLCVCVGGGGACVVCVCVCAVLLSCFRKDLANIFLFNGLMSLLW